MHRFTKNISSFSSFDEYSEYRPNGRRNFFSPITQYKAEKSAELSKESGKSVKTEDLVMTYQDYSIAFKDSGIKNFDRYWNQEKKKDSSRNVFHEPSMNDQPSYLQPVELGNYTDEELGIREEDRNEIDIIQPDETEYIEGLNRCFINIALSSETEIIKASAFEELLYEYDLKSISNSYIERKIELERNFKVDFEDIDLNGDNVIKEDYCWKIKKVLHKKNVKIKNFFNFDDQPRIEHRDNVEWHKREILECISCPSFDFDSFERSFFFFDRQDILVPKLQVALIPSGGGKSYIFKRHSRYFVDVDFLRRNFDNDEMFEIIHFYSKETGRWKLLNDLWKYIIYNQFESIGDRILLAHSKYQLPPGYSEHDVIGIIPNLDDSYDLRYFKNNKISIISEVPYHLVDRRIMVYSIFKYFKREFGYYKDNKFFRLDR